MINKRIKITIAILSLIILYDLTTLIEYTIGFPERKPKINPKIQEIIEIDKNTELLQAKIERDKRKKKEEELRIAEENFIKSITPTKEEIEQSKNVYKTIDFSKTPDKKAVDIFYDFIMKENSDCAPLCTSEISSKDLYYAYFVDLNDDGVDEIIGIVSHSMYRGSAGDVLFILKKYKNYQNIVFTNHRAYEPIKILYNKTNGYHDIMLIGPGQDMSQGSKFVIQFGNDFYRLGYNLGLIKQKGVK